MIVPLEITIAWVIVGLLFFLTYAGLILPILPDYPLTLVGFVVFHFFINDQVLAWYFWITAVFIALILIVIDYISSSLAVNQKGGSKWGVLASFVGLIIFPFFMGPLGVVVGPFAMVFFIEYVVQKKQLNEALEIGYSTLLGFLGGVIVKFLIITAMLCWFLLLNVL